MARHMSPEESRRYRQALEFAHNAEKEIVRLKARIAELEESTVAMTIVAEGALEALEALSVGHA